MPLGLHGVPSLSRCHHCGAAAYQSDDDVPMESFVDVDRHRHWLIGAPPLMAGDEHASLGPKLNSSEFKSRVIRRSQRPAGDECYLLWHQGAIMNLLFLVLSAFAGAVLSIACTWPWLGAIAILVAPVGAAVACAASAALLFVLGRTPPASTHALSVIPMHSRRPQQQPPAGAKNADQTELKRSA